MLCVPARHGTWPSQISLSYGLRRNLMPWLQGSSSDGQGLPCRLTPTISSCPTANVVSSSYPAISTTFNKKLQCIKLQQYPWCHCPLQISHGTVTLASNKTHVRGEAEIQAIPAELWSQAAGLAIAECSMWFDLKCVNNALPHNASCAQRDRPYNMSSTTVPCHWRERRTTRGTKTSWPLSTPSPLPTCPQVTG